MQDVIPPPGGHRPKIGTHATREERGAMEDTGEATTVVDTGAEVDDITAAVEGGVEAAPVATVGELGEAALDLATESPDEATAETEPDDGDLVPDTVIEDKALAEEMAYAEKPFRDAQVEQAEKLTPENKELLDWLASEAAEKAMTKYTEAKAQVSEVELVLREKAAEISQLSNGDIAIFARHNTRLGMGEEERVAITEDTQALVSKIIGLELEKILADPDLSDKERLSRIAELGQVPRRATEVLKSASEVNGEESAIRPYEQSGRSIETVTAILWGHAAATIAAGYPFAGVGALKLIAERTGEDVTDLIDMVIPEIVKGKTEHNVGFQSNNDAMMEGYGYVWSQSRKTYVKVAN